MTGQESLFGETPDRIPYAAPPSVEVMQEKARRRLHRLLATARSANIMPWGPLARMWQIVFPQMANWLPLEEADQLRSDFAKEIARLTLATVRSTAP